MFDLLEKRHKQIKNSEEMDAYLYVVKLDELNDFKDQLERCAKKGKEGIHLFKSMFNVDPREIVGYGDSTYNKKLCDSILQSGLAQPINSIHKKRYYKCFGAIDHFSPNRIVGNQDHETGELSWNCLLTIMGRPKNVIMRVVRKIEDKNVGRGGGFTKVNDEDTAPTTSFFSNGEY